MGKKVKVKEERMATRAEKNSYGLYFLGINIFYLLIYAYMNTYFTDIGIPAIAVAGIALVVKIWDAVNDPIFGVLVDKVKFKKGKFLPWLKIALVGIPVSTVLLFAIPTGLPVWGKIIWAVVAYILWDTLYTISDVPIFGLVTTMTSIPQERVSITAFSRVCSMIAILAVSIIIPTFRTVLGGWTATVAMLAVVGLIAMAPINFTAKERVMPESQEGQEFTFKEMFRYLKGNKYLLIFFGAYLVTGVFNVASNWGLYIARYCLQDESVMSLTSVLALAPSILFGMVIPVLTKRFDKFKMYFIASAVALVLMVVKYIVGYENLSGYLIVAILASLPTAFTSTLMFMFTPDCAEYGRYKTGIAAPGITFATQTFFVKMNTALTAASSALALAMIGFVEGEGAVQAAGFADKLWNWSIIVPAVGMLIALVMMWGYKLNDKDVILMTKCNAGEITREEAEAQMSRKY